MSNSEFSFICFCWLITVGLIQKFEMSEMDVTDDDDDDDDDNDDDMVAYN